MSNTSTAGAYSGHRATATFDRIEPGPSRPHRPYTVRWTSQASSTGARGSRRIPVEVTSRRGVRQLTTHNPSVA
jgi:hypothetical protein